MEKKFYCESLTPRNYDGESFLCFVSHALVSPNFFMWLVKWDKSVKNIFLIGLTNV